MKISKEAIKSLYKISKDEDLESIDIFEDSFHDNPVLVALVQYGDYRGDKWTNNYILTERGIIEI